MSGRARDAGPLIVEQYKCGAKKVYDSERIAQRAADDRSALIGKRLYTYRCRHCKRYHMTKSAPGAPKR